LNAIAASRYDFATTVEDWIIHLGNLQVQSKGTREGRRAEGREGNDASIRRGASEGVGRALARDF
jgi:hypothetical protein